MPDSIVDNFNKEQELKTKKDSYFVIDNEGSSEGPYNTEQEAFEGAKSLFKDSGCDECNFVILRVVKRLKIFVEPMIKIEDE